MHRDIKPANILITKSGVLKVADFGMSSIYNVPIANKPNNFTNNVVTLCYRAPELLLGDRNYCTAIDIWSVGCIMGEMYTRAPILPGHTEGQQIEHISWLCGSITPDVWPAVQNLSIYKFTKLPTKHKRKVQDTFRPLIQDQLGCDLLDKLLQLDPSARYDTAKALKHNYFYT